VLCMADGRGPTLDIIERSFDNRDFIVTLGVAVSIGKSTPLAFVDVETTGLSPTLNRVAEIGVVTVHGDQIVRWTTLVKTPSRRESTFPHRSATADLDAAPFFADIATELAQRLSGRLLVAHNARFDHAFLRAEFDRVGIAFTPEVLCSVMLSRRLYPDFAHHDLDSLAASHGLRVEARHRALPDADLVWQLWQVILREHSEEAIGKTIKSLLAGPVLPPELNPSLIERLPDAPGAYVLHGEHNRPVIVGAAANLRRHVLNYFRIDRATNKALERSYHITNITWHATRGMLGARLHAASLDGVLFASAKRRLNSVPFTWQFSPQAVPSVSVVPLFDGSEPSETESFGVFPSERKARNALVRLATKLRLCHCLLGISGVGGFGCSACPDDQPGSGCVGKIDRKKQLMRAFIAITPLRIPIWPHRGPVGIRERSDIHVVDRWQFLGTGQSEGDIHRLLESRPCGFDRRIYRLLNRTLSQLPKSKIVDLSMCDHYSVRPVAALADTEV
jgi:DNA polymerase-3 subunit epsilon